MIYNFSDIPEKNLKKKSGDELIFLCPFCEDERGKPDADGKLYFNTKKGVGWCFKCNSTVLNGNGNGSGHGGHKKALRNTREERTYCEKFFNLRDWTSDAMKSEIAHSYLVNRNLSDENIINFNLRYCSKPCEGVIIPNGMFSSDGKLMTNFFQMRRLDNGKPKYINPKTQKPLYKPLSINESKYLIITEGVFSAISAYNVGYGFGVIGLYGKSLKKEFAHFLGKKIYASKIKHVFIALDGGEEKAAEKIRKALKECCVDLPIHIVKLMKGSDPNSLSIDELRQAIIDASPFSYKFFSERC